MNAVDPEIDVAFGREVALAPARVLFRPSLRANLSAEHTGRINNAGCRKQPDGDQSEFHDQPPLGALNIPPELRDFQPF
jgi:hypothetical protein